MSIEVLGAVSHPRKRFQTARAKCHWAAQLPVVSSAPGRPKSEELQTTAPSPTPTPLTPQTQTRPNRLHTHTHPPKRLAHPRSPIPPLSTLTARATLARPLHSAALASVPSGVVLVRVRVPTPTRAKERIATTPGCGPACQRVFAHAHASPSPTRTVQQSGKREIRGDQTTHEECAERICPSSAQAHSREPREENPRAQEDP
jgi:hypothetical protein